MSSLSLSGETDELVVPADTATAVNAKKPSCYLVADEDERPLLRHDSVIRIGKDFVVRSLSRIADRCEP